MVLNFPLGMALRYGKACREVVLEETVVFMADLVALAEAETRVIVEVMMSTMGIRGSSGYGIYFVS